MGIMQPPQPAGDPAGDDDARLARTLAGNGTVQSETTDPGAAPPRLEAPGLSGRLGDGEDHRFRIGPMLGAGGIGRVLLVEDANLRRAIAVKTPLPWKAADPAAVAAFVTEARITASLEHPGIVPVYDLDISADGQVFYAMRRVEGRSLAAVIGEALESGRRPAEIASANDIVTLMLKACEALTYAHSRGVLHSDLKPDNIMVGGFGEVLVLDWGSSSSPLAGGGGVPAGTRMGTPAFMSPEQARLEELDVRSDVYSLGATLFQTLFLRFPLTAPSVELLIERKRRGELDPMPMRELDAHTRPLAAIALKAMAADRGDRYASVHALAADLRAYQAGQAMTAYRGSVSERIGRWLRRWARALAVTGICTASILLAVWLVWGERMKQVATWGSPVVSEAFSDGSWRSRWDCWPADAFAVRDGRLVSTAPFPALARCLRPLAGPVAIEFRGEITPGSRPCDLSVAWWDGEQPPDWSGKPKDGWLLQAGALDDNCCAIYRCRGGELVQVARVARRLEPGRTYRIRAELDGGRLSLALDGETVLAYEDIFPVTPGHIGLYAYYPGKAFDDVRIYSKGLAERISPIALGDDDAQEGNHRRAIARYQRVIASHPDGPLASEAWYKIGLCQHGAGDDAAALLSWGRITDPAFAERAELGRLDLAFAAGRHDEVIAQLPAAAGTSAAARSQAEGLWTRWVDLLRRDPRQHAVLDRYLGLRQRLFPGSGPSLVDYCLGLCELRRYEQALAECDGEGHCTADALIHLGRPLEAEARVGNRGWLACWLYQQAGQPERILEADGEGWRIPTLAKMGRIDEALRESGDHPDWQVLAAAGDWDRLLRLPLAKQGSGELLARFATGRVAEAVECSYRTPPQRSREALLLLGRLPEAEQIGLHGIANAASLRLLAALDADDHAAAGIQRAAVAGQRIDWAVPTEWFGPCVLLPFLAWRDGDAAAWDAALAEGMRVRTRTGQRLWHLAAFLSGRIDEAGMRAQPYRAEAEAWLRVAQGLRAEHDGDRAAALAAYRAFRDLPLEKRLLAEFSLDPLVERFVAWRVQDLSPR